MGILHNNHWLFLRRLTQLLVIALFLMGPLVGWWLVKGNMSSSLTLDAIPLTEPFLFLQMLATGAVGHFNNALIGVLVVVTFLLEGEFIAHGFVLSISLQIWPIG